VAAFDKNSYAIDFNLVSCVGQNLVIQLMGMGYFTEGGA